MSATLNVGHRIPPTPTSMKSTTPRPDLSRSTRLPTAPPLTSARASVRTRSPARVERWSSHRTASAPRVSAVKIQRDQGPKCRPNAAPELKTSVNRSVSPSTSRGTRDGTRRSTATIFVTASASTTDATTPKKRRGFGLLLSIFLALLALDAVAGVRQRVEAFEPDLASALVAAAVRLRRAVQASQRFVDVPEKAALLAREEERLLALARVGALVGHVERVRGQVAVGALRRGAEGLVVMAKLLEHALAFLEQPLLKVRDLLLDHRLELLFAVRCWRHRQLSRVRARCAVMPSSSRAMADESAGSTSVTIISRASTSPAIHCRCCSAIARSASGPAILSRIRSLTASPVSFLSRWMRLTISRAIPSARSSVVSVVSMAAKRAPSSCTTSGPLARRWIVTSSVVSWWSVPSTPMTTGSPRSNARRTSDESAATAAAARGVSLPQRWPSARKFGFASSETSAPAVDANSTDLTLSSAASNGTSSRTSDSTATSCRDRTPTIRA